MAEYPTTARPKTATVLAPQRDQLRNQFDGGAIAVRAKYLRSRVTNLQLTYLVNFAEWTELLDFWETVAGPVLDFGFTYPYSQSVLQVQAGTPAVVQVPFLHGLQTGHQVRITGNTQAPVSPNAITRISKDTFSLDGHTALATESGGQVARYFPKMAFVGESLTPATPLWGQGPPVDDGSYIPLVVTLEER